MLSRYDQKKREGSPSAQTDVTMLWFLVIFMLEDCVVSEIATIQTLPYQNSLNAIS